MAQERPRDKGAVSSPLCQACKRAAGTDRHRTLDCCARAEHRATVVDQSRSEVSHALDGMLEAAARRRRPRRRCQLRSARRGYRAHLRKGESRRSSPTASTCAEQRETRASAGSSVRTWGHSSIATCAATERDEIRAIAASTRRRTRTPKPDRAWRHRAERRHGSFATSAAMERETKPSPPVEFETGLHSCT